VDLVAGRVEELRAVEQAKPGRDDPDLGILERADELCERPGGDDGVGVEEDERLAGGAPRTLVAAGGEADVRTGRDDLYPFPLRRRFDLRPAASVVDDDDLVGLRERVQQPPERGPRAVRDDDDRAA
jgi:hypothetical protein